MKKLIKEKLNKKDSIINMVDKKISRIKIL